ncbi:MAG: protein-methionine-sulfoxide reductase catalytic subunit MsrP [Myxococcota bacterium]
MRVRRAWEVSEGDITPERHYLSRRDFLGRGTRGLGVLAGASVVLAPVRRVRAHTAAPDVATLPPLEGVRRGPFTSDEERTSLEDVTSYNNFYEFGTGKRDPARRSGSLRPRPWSVAIEGEVARPGRVPLETLLAPHPLEERVYRLRCVEAWSMVIPWIGIPLGKLLERFQPTSRARYVAFRTLHDPEQMSGQRRGVLQWPYREGLRMDEAVHPLTLLAVGLYGRELPNQNGAPLRLVVPWKYGFKSIKSIVGIRLTETQPGTSWSRAAPREYGFFANVNPEVDHPRWSQRRERRIGEFRKRPTLLFNGYGEAVAALYRGMDLRKNF